MTLIRKEAYMSAQPTLSVLIANYNHARYLLEALEAILAQSYRPVEIIVADDASTDNSVEIIQSFARENSLIRLVRNDQNIGVVLNGNRLLELASGEYVYFAAADDRVLPGLFEKSMRLLAQYPQAGLCSALARLMNETSKDIGLKQSRIISRQASFLSAQECRRALEQHGGWMVGSTTIFSRQALLDAGGFIPELGPYVDGFTQQVIALRSGVCFIPEPLANWRRMETGYSQTVVLDVEQHLEWVNYMTRLMRTTYRDLFPPEYVAQQERECLYGVGVAAGRNLQRAQAVYVDHMRRALFPLNLLDRGLLTCLQTATRLQTWLITGYLFARRRRLTWELLRRRAAWIREKMRARMWNER